MFKKILHITGWVLVVAYMFVALAFTTQKSDTVKCSRIDVQVLDKSMNFFVEEEDVLQMFTDKKIRPLGMRLNAINLADLENLLYTHSAIKKAEVYTTITGVLKIDIHQRVPILRIMNKNGDSYYMDEEGKLMLLSDKYTAHVLVVNGEINQSFARNISKDFSKPADGDLSRDSLLNDLFTLGKYIWNNDLWRSQIEQIYINNQNEIEMIPRIGSHTVIFGNVKDYEDKFFKLEAMYKQGLNNVGWKKYKDINIKFKNQVICTKFE